MRDTATNTKKVGFFKWVVRLFCLLIISLFLGSTTSNSFAQAAQTAFDRANEQLAAGSYRKAIRDYETIL